MPYKARKMLAAELQKHHDQGTGLFCVEHESGQVVQWRMSWLDACIRATELSKKQAQQSA